MTVNPYSADDKLGKLCSLVGILFFAGYGGASEDKLRDRLVRSLSVGAISRLLAST